MASYMSMVSATPAGLEIHCRRRLGDAKAFEAFHKDLSQRLTKAVEANPASAPVIADLDLSQNKLTQEQFEEVFNTLSSTNARVERFRLFGCATLGDEVMRVIADYLRGLPDSETAPSEMHLSDCAITADGFQQLMTAVEETDLYPKRTQSSTDKGQTLYLRVENNYIGEETIQLYLDGGLLQPWSKTSGNRMAPLVGGHKVSLVQPPNRAGFGQKQGDPPAPDNAPPPKWVNDKFGEWMNQQSGKGAQGWNSGKGAAAAVALAAGLAAYGQPAYGGYGNSSYGGYGGKGGSWQQPVQQQQRPPFQHQPQPVRPVVPQTVLGKGAANIVLPPAAGVVPGVRPAVVAGGKAAGGGYAAAVGSAAARAADRSRTPAPRQPAVVPAAKPKLPYPWEEHWSDEYSIPYYWNSETGDSMWTPPQ
eukprot:TRINITY_DN14114_c0_g1_i1.p1 TRINITY_DN14114_c0_g1~~TRINITY_DN14114_c0_g1_i1.p1  ORF type:complete len:419 (+),score=89.99 TRINITY_DN14114_c0_g1_i1:100-1356(+)